MTTVVKSVPSKQTASSIATFNPEQINVLKNSIAKGATDEELELFLYTCKRTGLDPFSRQIYLIQRKTKDDDSKEKKSNGVIQVSIDGFRSIASRNPEYAGQTTTLFCGKDGKWTEIWTQEEYPFAAKVGIYRKGYQEATYAIAKWDSYVQCYWVKNNHGKNSQEVSSMWKKFPELMLGKCAEALALRKAFPSDLSGLYTADEMAQANNEVIEAQEVKDEAQKPKLPSTKEWTEQNKKITEVQQKQIEEEVNTQSFKKVPAQVAQAQKVLDKKEKALEAEVIDNEIVYNGSDDHKSKFKEIFRCLKIFSEIKNDMEKTVELATYFSERCLGVPLKHLKEHLINIENEYKTNFSKNSSAA